MISRRRILPPRKSTLLAVDAVRSHIMRSVPQTNSKPEVAVRRWLHFLGFRFRLHDKRLPGTPDITLPKYKTCIFVHGCFWHRHDDCPKTTHPKTRVAFWAKKFRDNVARDGRNVDALKAMGWKPLVIWECEAKDAGVLARKIGRPLSRAAGVRKGTRSK